MRNFAFKSVLVLAMSMAFLGCSSDDGSSDCPQGFSGANCDVQLTPNKISIYSITVKNYPLQNPENDPWDSGEDTSGPKPDLWMAFAKDGVLIQATDYFVDVTGDKTFVFTTPIEITNVTALYSVYVYDFDGGNLENSETVAQHQTFLYNPIGGFPNPLIATSTELTTEFNVVYEW